MRLTLVGMVVAALLGVAGGAVTALSEGDDPRVTQFTGTVMKEQMHVDDVPDWEEDGVYYSRGATALIEVELRYGGSIL